MAPLNTIVNSMLWAAYGDALGFITELCDKKTLKYRTHGIDYVTQLIRGALWYFNQSAKRMLF